MAHDDLASAHAKIRAFIQQDVPPHRLMVVRARPELSEQALKILRRVEGEEEVDAVFFPYVESFEDAASFYRAWFEEIAESFEEYGGELEELGAPLPDLASLEYDSVCPEVSFAVLVDRMARAMAHVTRRVVLLTVTSLTAEPARLRTSLATLAAHLDSSRVRLIVVDDEVAAQADETENASPFRAIPRSRIQLVAPWSGQSGAAEALDAFWADTATRVALVAGADATLTSLENLLTSPARAQPLHAEEIVGLSKPFTGPRRYSSYLIGELLPGETLLAARAGPAEVAEAVLRVGAENGKRAIVVDVRPIPRAEWFLETVEEFAAFLSEPDVKLLFLVDDDLSLPPSTLPTEEVSIDIDPGQALDVMKAQLADPGTTPALKLRALNTLTMQAAAEGKLERAEAYLKEAEPLAEAHHSQPEGVLAALAAHTVAYRKGDHERAVMHGQSASDQAIAGGDLPLLCHAVLALGSAHFMQGAYDEAAGCYGTAASLFRKVGQPLHAVYAAEWQGEALLRQARDADAKQVWAQALVAADAIGLDYAALVAPPRDAIRLRLAMLLEKAGDDDAARELRRLIDPGTELLSHP